MRNDEDNCGYLGDGVEHKPTPPGCLKVVREPDQLQLDIDTTDLNINELRRKIDQFEKTTGMLVNDAKSYPSRSKGWHVIVELGDAVADDEAIAYQLFFGSDPIRELISMARITNGVDEPSILFMPEGRKPKSIYS